MKQSKYGTIDWTELQLRYDDGASWRELGKTNAALAWGVKMGKLKTRSRSVAVKLRYSSGKVDMSPWKSKEFRRKCAKNGGLKPNAGRCKLIRHLSPIAGEVFLNGEWEYKYALWLDAHEINWKRNTDWFPYNFDGKLRKYFPDFYLIDTSEYVEVKGYETKKDAAKWSQFPKKLLVLKRKDLTGNPYNLKL